VPEPQDQVASAQAETVSQHAATQSGSSSPQHLGRQPDVRVGSTTNGLMPVSVAERSLGAGVWQWTGLAAVVAAAIAGDQLTKHVVTSRLTLDEASHVAGPLAIHRVENSGIAFGLFTSATSAVIALTGIAVLWMLIYFARSGARHPVIPAGLGLLIGGSVSNLVDRVRLGHVTDFIDFGWWPAFNLADSFIVIGVAILLAAVAGADRRPKRVRRHLDVAAR
jgi:signal peptidase II